MPNGYYKIDWDQQWADHGADFRDGFVHVNLKQFGLNDSKWQELKLKPGPGFGDFSHPTTRLVLEMMRDAVVDKHVLDIGSGSGILSLAAVAMGAKSVHGVEIDPDAVEHAKINAEVNGMQKLVTFALPQDYKGGKQNELLVMMNMIQSEQVIAWDSLKQVHNTKGECIISGILAEDLEIYIKQTNLWGWKFLSQIQREGWLGLRFMR